MSQAKEDEIEVFECEKASNKVTAKVINEGTNFDLHIFQNQHIQSNN